jgi:hypothetical protein
MMAVLLTAVLAKPALMAFLVLDTKIAYPGRLPDGWRIKLTHGTPDVTVIRDSQGSVLQLKSHSSSFGLERSVDVNPGEYPYLTWRWKVTKLPPAGDFRHSNTDDQAAQVLVAFDDRRVLTYIWDSNAPKDLMESASAIPLVHIFAVVCRSGSAEINQWLSEARNVSADYQRAYGRRTVPRVKGVRLQINAQHTGTTAESYFGDVAFRNSL